MSDKDCMHFTDTGEYKPIECQPDTPIDDATLPSPPLNGARRQRVSTLDLPRFSRTSLQ